MNILFWRKPKAKCPTCWHLLADHETDYCLAIIAGVERCACPGTQE